MVNLAGLSVFLLGPAALLAAPTTGEAPASDLEKRTNCGVTLNLNYYSDASCSSDSVIDTINWQNWWTGYNYQRSDVQTFKIDWSDWRHAQCDLYDDWDGPNGNGQVIASPTWEWYTGVGDAGSCWTANWGGAAVKSINCYGTSCYDG